MVLCDDDITSRHLSSGLFLGRFSGFTDFSLVFVHVKSKRSPAAFLSIASRCPCYFQIYDSLRLSIPSSFYLSLYSCDCDIIVIVLWDSRQVSQDQFQWKPENLPRKRPEERFSPVIHHLNTWLLATTS